MRDHVDVPQGRPVIRLLDALPELGAKLDDSQRSTATRHVVAPVVVLEPGRVGSAASMPTTLFGMVVLEGLLSRAVVIGDTTATELVGRGDLLRPHDHDGEFAPIPFDVDWHALERTRLAVLDDRVSALLCHWPQIVAELVGLAVQRSRTLALNLAVSHMRRVDIRLLLLLWHLADRWGHVTRDGVRVPLKLTHETLGRLVGAQRPSVTTALSDLARRGVIERREDGAWLLHGDPPGVGADAAARNGAAPQAATA